MQPNNGLAVPVPKPAARSVGLAIAAIALLCLSAGAVSAQPNLTVSKDDFATVASAGETLVYTIVYWNNGDQPSTTHAVYSPQTGPADRDEMFSFSNGARG